VRGELGAEGGAGRRRAAAILLVLGGLLIAGAGFLPPGHERTHWSIIQESTDMLLNPDEGQPFGAKVFWSGEIVGLAYPMAAGLALAAAGVFARCPWVAWSCFLLHGLFFCALGGLTAALAFQGSEMTGAERAYLIGGSALLWTFLGIEVVLWFGARGATRTVDRVSFLPAGFLFFLNLILAIATARLPDWSSTGYVVGTAGGAAAVLGLVMRRPSRVRSAAPLTPQPGAPPFPLVSAGPPALPASPPRS
jgi:hypothetical protein